MFRSQQDHNKQPRSTRSSQECEQVWLATDHLLRDRDRRKYTWEKDEDRSRNSISDECRSIAYSCRVWDTPVQIPPRAQVDPFLADLVAAGLDPDSPDLRLDPEYLRLLAARNGVGLISDDAYFAHCLFPSDLEARALIQAGDRATWNCLVYHLAKFRQIPFLEHWAQARKGMNCELQPGHWEHAFWGFQGQGDGRMTREMEQILGHLDEIDVIWVTIRNLDRHYLNRGSDVRVESSHLFARAGGIFTRKDLELVDSFQLDKIWEIALRCDCSEMPITAPRWAIAEQAKNFSEEHRDHSVREYLDLATDNPLAQFLFRHASHDSDQTRQLLREISDFDRYLLAIYCVHRKAYRLLRLMLECRGAIRPVRLVELLMTFRDKPLDNTLEVIQMMEVGIASDDGYLIKAMRSLKKEAKEIMAKLKDPSGMLVAYHINTHDRSSPRDHVISEYRLQFGTEYPRRDVMDPALVSDREKIEARHKARKYYYEDGSLSMIEIQRRGWFVYLWSEKHDSYLRSVIEIQDGVSADDYIPKSELDTIMSKLPHRSSGKLTKPAGGRTRPA